MSTSWIQALGVVARRPSVLARKARLYAESGRWRRQRIAWLAGLTGADAGTVGRLCAEIQRDREFLDTVRDAYRKTLRYFALPTDFMVQENGSTLFFHCVSLYALARIVKPQKIVETGGTPGKSSAFLLRALERNGQGRLWTIDMPPPPAQSRALAASQAHGALPLGAGSGWAVPGSLKTLHSLIVGDARAALPQLLRELREVDLFIHDSDHSYEHMQFEFETAYPFVKPGGFIWSDDILDHTAWQDFCRAHGLVPHDFTSQGVARKS